VITPDESRTARALLKWPQVRLAFENGRRILRPEKVVAIRNAFEVAGVVFAAGGHLEPTSQRVRLE